MTKKYLLMCNCILMLMKCIDGKGFVPMVANTWAFKEAAENAWAKLKEENANALDAVTVGCATCEIRQCDNTVGYGGSPDENGETTLDAMIFDGTSMDMGAVAGLRRIKDAISVARLVLEHTKHSFLAGDLATEFAKQFKFREESLTTNFSENVWKDWESNNCQPNFWKNVEPDPSKFCGPYEAASAKENYWYQQFGSSNHDTIGMIAIDKNAKVVAGTSTNGASHKIAGRVGDSPIPGAGAYADSEVGAAVATGDGDVMMRFLPSFLAVEEMRKGSSPTQAAQTAINRIVQKYPDFMGAVLAVTKQGEYGAACNGLKDFPFSVANEALGKAVTKRIPCVPTFLEPNLLSDCTTL